jgi:hypothetical protein
MSPIPLDQTGKAPIAGKASIEGSVLDALTREPVKKASVSLNGRIGLIAITDASGHFAFRQLPAGQYSMFVRDEKYPNTPFDTDQQLTLSVAAEEQKQDVRFLLTPGGSVRGHIVDEDGSPMGCSAMAMQFRDMGMGPTRQQNGFSQSDEKGEYRISNLPRGKYYIEAQCGQSVPLPHAFVRRTALMDVPTLTYAPLFYPGAPDPASAAKVQVSPGADVSGIDFRMLPVRGVTVRGHVSATADRNVQLTLRPRDPVGGPLRMQGARVTQETGEFQIRNVLPGSYELLAFSLDEARSVFAKASVEVGAAPLDPIDLTLAAAPALSGTMTFEGDAKTPMNSLHIAMIPLESRPMMGRQPQAEIQGDGTFAINSIMPGHWRLNVNGAPGYVKSVRQGDQEVTPWDFETGTSAVQLKVVVSTKFAQVEATLATPAAAGEPVSAMLWAASGDPNFVQNIGVTAQGPATISVPPGKYYACALAAAQPWMLIQNRALRKGLESHCTTVDVPEAGKASVQLPLVSASDLKQLLEKIEE